MSRDWLVFLDLLALGSFDEKTIWRFALGRAVCW